MKLDKYLEILDEISPFELQESWDNSGLIIGEKNLEIKNVYISLDIEHKMLDDICENSLLIVHHPTIFKALVKIDFNEYPANIIKKAIKKDISIVAMHTNYDKTHLNRYVLERVLGYEMTKKEDFLAYFNVEKEFENFAKEIAQKLDIKELRTVNASKYIKTAAICTGAGASFFDGLKADLLLTGDIKYHEALAAKEQKISLIDIGHFESECFFPLSLQEELQNKGINGIIVNFKNPFSYIKG